MDEDEPISRSDVAALEEAVPELARQFDWAFPEAEVYRLLFGTYAKLRHDATVHEYLVTLARRLTRDHLMEVSRRTQSRPERQR